MAGDAPTARPGWLFGPGPDLLLGCGGAYAIVFALMSTWGDGVRLLAPHWVLPLLVLVTGVPHYGATLLRVYERGEDRRTYRVFGLWATVAVFAWFVLGVYDVAVGSWLVTIYLTWSPWHYTGQNYGIAVLFLRRRGVDVSAPTKRWIYASFVLSYAITFVGTHAALASTTYAPVSLVGSSYRLIRLGIPAEVYDTLLPALTVAYVVATGVFFARLRHGGSWRDLVPAAALTATQALWFSVPVLFRATGAFTNLLPFHLDFTEYAFLWIAIAHSIQYLWVTTYYALSSNRGERRNPYLSKTLVAGCAIWGVPLLLFGPDMLGPRGYDAGLALLVAAVVNIHHFILDGAIWKLRDGRIARVLLRSRAAAAPTPPATDAARSGAGRLVWALAAAVAVGYAVSVVVGTLEFEFGVRRASDPPDFARQRAAVERLRWVGRDHPDVRYNLGMEALRSGELEAARTEFERSLSLSENPHSWVAIGIVEQRSRAWQAALAAFESALALDPENVAALNRSSQMWLRLGDRARARAALARAVEVAPERDDLRERLERLDAPAV